MTDRNQKKASDISLLQDMARDNGFELSDEKAERAYNTITEDVEWLVRIGEITQDEYSNRWYETAKQSMI